MFNIFDAVKILRAEHPDWKGDRILNAEVYCSTFYKEDPTNAKKLRKDLIENHLKWSDDLGISPDRVLWFAQRLV